MTQGHGQGQQRTVEMSERTGIFAGDDPFIIAQEWLAAAEQTEPNDPNAIALATVNADGLPNVRMVLLKQIEANGAGQGGFVFSPITRV